MTIELDDEETQLVIEALEYYGLVSRIHTKTQALVKKLREQTELGRFAR